MENLLNSKEIPELLLVQLPPWDPRTVPLGAAYLAAFLKSRGIHTTVLDLNIEMYNSENDERKKGWGNEDFHWWHSDRLEERYLSRFEHFAEKILSFNKQVVGFSATIPSIPFLNYLTKSLKKKSPDKIIIVGGPATFFRDTRRDFDVNFIDYFVVGDGEVALYELLNNLNDIGMLRNNMPSSHNIKIWKDNLFEKTICIQTPTPADLNTLPYPTFEEFNLSLYTEGNLSRAFTLPIIFSKGCTRVCTFCSDRVLSSPYRCRKAENVVKEMVDNCRRYNNSNFRLNDLSFNANLKFLHELTELIIAQDLHVKWYGQAQVRPDIDDRLLSKMNKAGCRQFDLGVESLSDNVLSMMRKGYNAKDAIRFLKASKNAGIENNILLIVGYPGETEDDFAATIKCLRENAAYIDRVGSLNICGMPVGSELRNNPRKYNYFFPPKGDWVSCDLTNTFAVRKRRYNEVISCCKELGIKVEQCLDLEIFEKQFI